MQQMSCSCQLASGEGFTCGAALQLAPRRFSESLHARTAPRERICTSGVLTGRWPFTALAGSAHSWCLKSKLRLAVAKLLDHKLRHPKLAKLERGVRSPTLESPMLCSMYSTCSMGDRTQRRDLKSGPSMYHAQTTSVCSSRRPPVLVCCYSRVLYSNVVRAGRCLNVRAWPRVADGDTEGRPKRSG